MQNSSFLPWSSSILMEMLVAVLILHDYNHMLVCVGVCLVSTWCCKVQKYIIRVSVINSMHQFNSHLAGEHWSSGCRLNCEQWFVQNFCLWQDAFLDTNLDNCHSLFIGSEILVLFSLTILLPSVLQHCWLGIRKSIQHVKIDWWGAGVVICLENFCIWYGDCEGSTVEEYSGIFSLIWIN